MRRAANTLLGIVLPPRDITLIPVTTSKFKFKLKVYIYNPLVNLLDESGTPLMNNSPRSKGTRSSGLFCSLIGFWSSSFASHWSSAKVLSIVEVGLSELHKLTIFKRVIFSFRPIALATSCLSEWYALRNGGSSVHYDYGLTSDSQAFWFAFSYWTTTYVWSKPITVLIPTEITFYSIRLLTNRQWRSRMPDFHDAQFKGDSVFIILSAWEAFKIYTPKLSDLTVSNVLYIQGNSSTRNQQTPNFG